MDNKIKGIYKIRNCINGKVYVGQSINIKDRFSKHKYAAKKNLSYPLYNAIKKYGKENFEFVLIEEIENVSGLDLRELYWINYYKSTDRNYGYNIRTDCRTNKGKKHSDDTKRKISKASKKMWENPEIRDYLSKCRKGRKCSEKERINISKRMLGHSVSEKTKKKISEKAIIRNANPLFKEKCSDIQKKVWSLPENKKIRSDAAKVRWADANFKEKMIKKLTGRKIKVGLEKRSEIVKNLWKDPIYREKMLESRKNSEKYQNRFKKVS